MYTSIQIKDSLKIIIYADIQENLTFHLHFIIQNRYILKYTSIHIKDSLNIKIFNASIQVYLAFQLHFIIQNI